LGDAVSNGRWCGVSPVRNVIIDISKEHGIKIVFYNEKGLKINEVDVDAGNVQLINPEYVVISRYMMKSGILITARNIKDIKPGNILSSLKK